MHKITCHACEESFLTDNPHPRFCTLCGTRLSPEVGRDNNPVQSTVGRDTNPVLPAVETPESGPDGYPVLPSEPAADLDYPTLAHIPRQRGKGFDQVTQDFSGTTPRLYSEESSALSKPKSPSQSLIGNYRLLRKLGQGGMGEVYQAENIRTHQQVALKLLSKSSLATDEAVERFQRESQIAASINHPHSTFVYEAGQVDGQCYISMELMPGQTLRDLVEQEVRLSVGRAVDYLLDVISGLQPAHAAGVVHRDLKPSNCFIDHAGRAKVGDYGLSKSYEAATDLTQADSFMGTPQFAAPEQLRSSDIGQSADIYALGATLFFLLTGRPPFVGNAARLISSIATDPPPDVRKFNDQVPAQLAKLIERTLDKNPDKRPENLNELRMLLQPFSTRGVSQADIGRRLAAFCIDIIIFAILISILAPFFELAGVLVASLVGIGRLAAFIHLGVFLQFFGLVSYFALQEWLIGTTCGKWQMGMRVINEKNESPSLFQAVVRACFIPGLSYLVSVIPLLGITAQTVLDDSSIESIMKTQLFFLLGILVNLAVLSTSRLSNGYRGIHGLLTSTRVVRLGGALSNKRPEMVPVTLPVSFDSVGYANQENFRGLELLGVLPAKTLTENDILVARDEALDRTVWLASESEEAAALPLPKSNGEFETRTLGRFRTNNQNWIVSEALQGMPLIDFLENSPRMGWNSLLPLIQDVVQEIQAIVRSEEPASEFSVNRIWITSRGQIRFLRWPTTATASAGGSHQSDGKRLQETAVAVLRSLLDTIIHRHDIPAHVIEFNEELAGLGEKVEDLNLIRGRLSDMEDRPSNWNWRDRLGVLAVSFSFEFIVLLSLMLLGSLTASYWLGWSIGVSGLTMFLLGIGLNLVSGYWLRGGLAFRLSGISILGNRSLKPVSGGICSIRNGLSWFLPLVWLTSLVIVIDLQAAQDSIAGNDFDDLFFALAFLLMILVPVLMMFAVVFAILRPNRGLVDLICGTRLIRE